VSVTGIVAALTAEARTLGPLRPGQPGAAGSMAIHTLADGNLLAISGMGPEAARRASVALVAAGAHGLLSFGLAGALDPGLGAGSVLLPEAVTDAAGTQHPTDAPWRARLASRAGTGAGRQPRGGSLLSVAQPLTQPAAKSQAWVRTGAVAVDMESVAIAAVALAAGLKFAVARVVIDTAADAVPGSVTRATDARGEVAYRRLAAGLLRRPVELFALLRLARRYRVALRSLRELAQHGVGLP
jgi:adenosylhomocysteine nucleosidase